MERSNGIRTIDMGSFSADFLWGDDVRKKRDSLMPITAAIDARTFMKDLPAAEEATVRKYSLLDINPRNTDGTSLVLYRLADSPIGENYGGYSLQQELEIRTTYGPRTVLFSVTRAFEEEFRDHKLGRFDTQQALVRHRRARALMHRTITPVSPWAIHQASVVDDLQYYPWAAFYGGHLYGEDPRSKLAQEIMFNGFFILREKGISHSEETPDPKTGRAVDDEGPNLAYEPKEGHLPTERLSEFMRERLHTIPGGTDRVYSVALLD